MTTHAICTWDFTLSKKFGDPKNILEKIAKKWCYQLEKGNETGYEHYQGRMSLKVKARLPQVSKLLPKARLSPTSDANKNNTFYVTKEDTRIDGPWTDQDMYIPKQIRGKTLYPWQEEVIKSVDVFDDRHINVIIDRKGNIGKSTLALWALCHNKGRMIPYCNNYKDMMRMTMGMPTSKLYMVDMPRSLDKKNLAGFFAGIEDLKRGYLWDDRYEWKEKVIDSPVIWVFMNEIPNHEYLSKDRWVCWEVHDANLRRLRL